MRGGAAGLPQTRSNDKSISALRDDQYRIMRARLTTKNSTKYERRFAEILKELHIPFRTKVRICGREVDFLIGKTIFEIDGHNQDRDKNSLLLESGYNVLHIRNDELKDKQEIKLWLTRLQT